MSEEIDIIIDNSIDIEAKDQIVSASSDNNIDVEILEPDYDITINKKEYIITGDNLYIPKSYEESPQWLKDIIVTITDFTLNQKLTEIGALSSTLTGLIEELQVAKNTYTQSIISSADIDERINTAITTLNSSIADSDATIVDMIATKATPAEASSLALNVLTSSINDGEIKSLVSNLQNTISSATSTLANNIDIVHSEMTGEFEANATVINSIQTYVGLDEAGASNGTGLSAYLEGSNGVIGSADSKVANNVYVDGNGNARSKFEYNSTVNVGGVAYNSGFGLSNSAGTGVGSEFWINADKFKFTNNAKSGSKAPFSIDASGPTPQITFNGIVSFSNVSNTQGSGTNLLYNSAPKIGNETKGWSIGWSNHGLSSSLNAGFDPWRPTGGASVYVVVPGNPGIGTVFDISNSRFPVVAGARYEASAYISSHRCNSWVTLAWFDSNGNYINESAGTSNGNYSSGPLANWSRSTMFATAPSNAATAQFYVRSSVTSDNPYCFVAYAYAGVASANQTIASNWSEGSSAGVSSSDVVSDINNGLTTTINGGKITTGSIEASQIAAGSITADKIDANAVSGKIISGGIITGTKLYGTQIEGAIIKASYIDLSSTATLTNWQQYTPVNYPSYYDANFAKNNNGTLLVDSQGYVRLMGNTNIITESVYMTSSIGSGYNYLTPVSVNLHSYDAYSVNTLNRVITSTPTFETTSQTIITLSSHYDWNSTHQVYLKVYLLGRLYEITSTRNTSSHTGEGSGSTVVYKDGTLVHNGTSGNYTQTTYTDTVTVGKLGFSIIANSSSIGDGVGITVSSIYTSSAGNSSFTGVANTFLNILSGYSYCSSNSYPGNAVISTVNIPSVKVV